jgi:hypothetical protein
MRNLLLIIFSFFLLSCSDSKKEKSGFVDGILEDFSKMPDSVIQKGFAILDTIQLKPVDEMVKELRQIPELQEIGVGDELLSFRLKNGPTMLIKLKEFSSLTKGGTADAVMPPLMILNPIMDQENKANVVGAQRGENRQNKKAFVLAPYAWQFGVADDPLIPFNKLPKYRNYKDRVTYKANKTKNEQQISFEDYLSFNNYDVVHFSSHGSKTCKLEEGDTKPSSNCRTYISSGIKYEKKDRQKLIDLIKSKNVRGISLEYGELFFIPKFFSDAYPKVNNKLFIFSSCELGQQGDLQTTFNNILQNGQLFYWQNITNALDAYKTFHNLYDRMLQYGETANMAYKNMPDSLKNNIPFFKHLKEGGDTQQTYNFLKMSSRGNAMHIIEPISFIDEKTKVELQEGAVYPFEGILEDDKPEKASFTLEFLGYTLQEMKDKGMRFSLKLDGNTVLDHISFVPDTDPNDDIEVQAGKNEKTTLVTFKAVDLKKDLKKNSTVKLEALFHFSDKNYGYQMINVATSSSDMRIVMRAPDGTINMYFDADNYGLKMTHPAENATLYSDEEGYIYVNLPGQGWVKTKLLQMLGAIAQFVPMDIDFIDLKMNKGSVMHKIPAFAAEITISMLEKEPKAKKLNDGIGTDKTVFIYDGRLTITFDNQKRLESLAESGANIQYYYEEQQITMPSAQTFSLPLFN